MNNSIRGCLNLKNRQSSLAEKIEELKMQRNAIVLAHNYQIGEVQDIADYVGDSLGLSQKAVGSDADLLIFDPKALYEISAKTHHQNVDYTPYEGYKGKGAPKIVFSKGQIIIRDGEFLGQPGAGRFLKRKPFRLTA